MPIIIPKKNETAKWVREFKADGNVDRYLTPQNPTDVSQNSQTTISPLVTQISIDTRKYIQLGINRLGGNAVAISPYEIAESNNMNYENTHKFVLKQGLYMPTPKIFMTHFVNVLEAKKGRKNLVYADGTKVPDVEVEEMYQHLTKNHKNMFGRNDAGVWTWLNAEFRLGQIITVKGLGQNGDLIKASASLENCLNEDAYVSLDFNNQGLSTTKSADQSYRQGENIRFWYPREGCVAGFDAISDGAGLYCNGNPSDTDGGLGVFACAEGTARAKK